MSQKERTSKRPSVFSRLHRMDAGGPRCFYMTDIDHLFYNNHNTICGSIDEKNVPHNQNGNEINTYEKILDWCCEKLKDSSVIIQKELPWPSFCLFITSIEQKRSTFILTPLSQQGIKFFEYSKTCLDNEVFTYGKYKNKQFCMFYEQNVNNTNAKMVDWFKFEKILRKNTDKRY